MLNVISRRLVAGPMKTMDEDHFVAAGTNLPVCAMEPVCLRHLVVVDRRAQ